jgi:hypothetical protein
MSGLRQEFLDGLVYRKLLKIERPETDDSKLAEPAVLAAVRFASDNLYRYYQFYSNMAIAILSTYLAWLVHQERRVPESEPVLQPSHLERLAATFEDLLDQSADLRRVDRPFELARNLGAPTAGLAGHR